MYQPHHFQVDDARALHDLIRNHALGLVVTNLEQGLEANHVPVLLDPDSGPHGRLRFHLARANPLVEALDGQREALFVFQGQSSYVSPDWYRSAHMVPTWNYAVVHAYGVPRAVDDAGLIDLLDGLSASQEGRLEKPPWTADKLPSDVYASMRRAIAGFEMPIRRLQGKWKMSQNRRADDRRGVIAALEDLGHAAGAETAQAMRDLLDREVLPGKP
jgi:transcriptional regulator